MNSFDENIQFTFESESKSTLPFLMCYYVETVENLQQQFTETKLTMVFT